MSVSNRTDLINIPAFGYYSLNKVFIADKGPQMYSIHVGVTFVPFYKGFQT